MRDVREMANEKIRDLKDIVRHEESIPVAVKPMDNSINAEVDRTTKTTVQKMYSDDYLSDNAVHFDAILNCRRTQVKFNT
jgi:hypothetical protein